MGLKFYDDMNDAPLSELLWQSSVKIENQLMVLSDSSRQDFPDNVRSTGSCIILYKGGIIDHITHVLGPVAKSKVYSGYNAACIAGMVLAHFRMFNIELFNKETYIVP